MKMNIEPGLRKMNSRLETLEQDSLCAVVMIHGEAVDKLIKDVANHSSTVSDETSVSGKRHWAAWCSGRIWTPTTYRHENRCA